MEPSLSELYFCDLAILVEGAEDVAYLSAHLAVTNQLDWFRRHGCHFVICRGKTNISRPLAIAQSLKIPTFVVFDNDYTLTNTEALRNAERDNKCLLALAGMAGVDPMSKIPCIGENAAMLTPSITAIVKADYGADVWEKLDDQVRKDFKLTDGVKGKNSYLIAHLIEAAFKSKGPSSTLEKVVGAIKARADASRT